MAKFPVPSNFPAQTRTRIDSDEGSDVLQDTLLERIFQVMYDANDVDETINAIMALVGGWYDISRVSVFEDDPDGEAFTNTYEWLNEGVTSQKDLIVHRRYDKMGGDYRESFDARGIFCCPDVDTLPDWQRNTLRKYNIQSLLQCAIVGEDGYRGFIGFDDCNAKRLWTKDQIDTLVFVTKLLTSLLAKRHG